MREIKTLAEAQAFCQEYCIPETHLPRRAREIASGILREVESKKGTFGDTCSHYGGDYWFHFGAGAAPAGYLCNLPPCPPGHYPSAVEHADYYEAVLAFLKTRNAYFQRAVAYFRARARVRS